MGEALLARARRLKPDVVHIRRWTCSSRGSSRSPGRRADWSRSGRHRIAGRPDYGTTTSSCRPCPAWSTGSGARKRMPIWVPWPLGRPSRSDRPGRAGRRRLISGLVHLPIRGIASDSRGRCEGPAAENLTGDAARYRSIARSADHSGPAGVAAMSRSWRGVVTVNSHGRHRRRIRS